MNRTAPQPVVTTPGEPFSPEALAIIATLARTYDAQRQRLLERRRPSRGIIPASPLRSLFDVEAGIVLDDAPVSASIVDAVVNARALAEEPARLPLPIPAGPDNVHVAEAGWWDALLGDVERRSGLPPRSIRISLHPDASTEVRAVFADRVAL
jgi:hypothetical protein